VRYVFKDFPIHSIHSQAQKAHESARCARELGGDEAFWTMHDLLFINQEQWANNANYVAMFKSLAGEMELPQAEFDECLDSDRYADAVNAQVNEGVQLGVRGTPSFFINGQSLVGAQPFSVFQQAIEALLPGQE
jgi:protein-disulfide isomerase